MSGEEERVMRFSERYWPCVYQGGHPDFYMEGIQVKVYFRLYLVGRRYVDGQLIFQGEGILKGEIPLMSINVNKIRIIKPEKPKVVKVWFGLRKRKVMEYTLVVPFSRDDITYEMKFSSENLGMLNSLLLVIKEYYKRIYSGYTESYRLQKRELFRQLKEVIDELELLKSKMNQTGYIDVERFSSALSKISRLKIRFESMYSDSVLLGLKSKLPEFYEEVTKDRDEAKRLLEKAKELADEIQSEYTRHIKEVTEGFENKVKGFASRIRTIEEDIRSDDFATILKGFREINELKEKLTNLKDAELGKELNEIRKRFEPAVDDLIAKLKMLEEECKRKLPTIFDQKLDTIKQNLKSLEEKIDSAVNLLDNIEMTSSLREKIESIAREIDSMEKILLEAIDIDIIRDLHGKLLNETSRVKEKLAEEIYQKINPEIEERAKSIDRDFKALGLR